MTQKALGTDLRLRGHHSTDPLGTDHVPQNMFGLLRSRDRPTLGRAHPSQPRLDALLGGGHLVGSAKAVTLLDKRLPLDRGF